MSRQYGSNVNASLIRELRMIAQNFFRHKEDMSFWGSRSSAPSAPAMKCARCLGTKKGNPQLRVNDAVTIFDGTALCEAHV